MIYRVILAVLAFFVLGSSAYAEDTIVKTGLNEFKISYNFHTAMRIIPQGLVDQAKEHIIVIYGADKLISCERSFHIGAYSYGYTAHKVKDGVDIYLISCSEGNESFATVSGICKKGDWQFELMKLLELSTKKLKEFDAANSEIKHKSNNKTPSADR